MNISSDPTFKTVLLDKIAKREFKERTGVHVSDLIYCLNKQALRRLNPKQIDENDLLLFSLGWSTQRWLTGQDKDEPEREVDGIIVTLDAQDAEGCPWELKATFQSNGRDVLDNTPWFRQIMAQCHVTGTKSAHLSRLEIMGNWKSIFGKKEEKGLPENRKPTLSVYKIDFTPGEAKQNWNWLLARADLFKEILNGGQLLPAGVAIPSGQEYECERCPYKGKECFANVDTTVTT